MKDDKGCYGITDGSTCGKEAEAVVDKDLDAMTSNDGD